MQTKIIRENQVIANLNQNPYIHTIHNGVTIELKNLSYPSVCCGEGDTIYAVCSLRLAHVDPFGRTILYTSKDNGETWNSGKIICNLPVDCRDAGIQYLGNGKLIVTFFFHDPNAYLKPYRYGELWSKQFGNDAQVAATEELYKSLPLNLRRSGSMILTSEDYGATWSESKRVMVTAPHGPSLMQDGKTLLYFGNCFDPWASVKGFRREAYHPINNMYAMTSDNLGETWEAHSICPIPKIESVFFSEGFAIELQNGELLGVMRGQGAHRIAPYITHKKPNSDWTMPIRDPEIYGCPVHFCEAKNGMIIMTYGYRWTVTGTRCRISTDGGYSWSHEIELSHSSQINDGDVGYPATIQRKDGSFLTVYYQRDKITDKQPSLMYTTWSL